MQPSLPEWIAKRIQVDTSDPDACWIWTGQITWGGYGQIRRNTPGVSTIAHRAVYQTVVGPIPEGLDLDHLCRVRTCVNPAHLEPVTRSENLRRSPLVGKHGLAKTECKHGHPRTPETTLVRADGRRQCKVCMVEAVRRWRARIAAAA